MRIIGIDYGSARIGAALGDTETRLATPWGVIQNHGDEAAALEIVELCRREGAEAVVIGIPRPLADPSRETEQAKTIRNFASRITHQGMKVIEADETLSSALAERQAAEMGEREKRDDLAAAAILQGYLDKRVTSDK